LAVADLEPDKVLRWQQRQEGLALMVYRYERAVFANLRDRGFTARPIRSDRRRSHFVTFVSFVVAVFFYLTAPPAASAMDIDVDSLCLAHRAALEAIQSLSCNFNFTPENVDGKPSQQTGSVRTEYWRSGAMVRAKVASRVQTNEYLLKDSMIWTITKQTAGQTLMGAGVGTADGFMPYGSNAWCYALLSFPTPFTQESIGLEKLIQRAKRQKLSKGRDGVVALTLTFPTDEAHKNMVEADSMSMDLFFDPAVNYLVRNWTSSQRLKAGGILRIEYAVESFREVEPAIFFPERVAARTRRDDQTVASVKAEFTNVQINRPISPAVFALRYPPGILFTDNIRRVKYTVDAAGRPISATVPLGPPKGPAMPAKMTVGVDSEEPAIPEARTATQAEPVSWTRWLLPVSMCLLIIACLLQLARYFRAARGGGHLIR
jgi:hypothetical protein